MVVWQDAGRPILKNQQHVWEPSPLHPQQLSVIFVHFFAVSRHKQQLCPAEAVCDKLSLSLFSSFQLLKNLIAVRCASGTDLKQPLNQLCCSFAELVFHILSGSSLVVVNDGAVSV